MEHEVEFDIGFADWLDSILGHDEPETIHDCIICGESPMFCNDCAKAYENLNPTISQHL